MAEKRYEWLDGATLEEHSRRKHKILREYFHRYLIVRCQLPQQTRFRLAVVDGFAGGGRYKCGTPGSPIIFLEELQSALETVNLQRINAGLGTIEIECLLILNDHSAEALEVLKGHLAPLLAGIKETCPRLHIHPEYLNKGFEEAFPTMRDLLAAGRYRNVVFNLDQCGHSHVDRQTLVEIMRTYTSAEIFYTFAIEALLAFLQKSEPVMLANQLRHLGIGTTQLIELNGTMSKGTWLRTAERIVFEAYRACAPYVSPFSINNPDGWRYWLIHFANVYRARQVYNNILHDNSSMQAHFGRSGLNMLSYDPRHDDGALYLFDVSGRQQAIGQLNEDKQGHVGAVRPLHALALHGLVPCRRAMRVGVHRASAWGYCVVSEAWQGKLWRYRGRRAPVVPTSATTNAPVRSMTALALARGPETPPHRSVPAGSGDRGRCSS